MDIKGAMVCGLDSPACTVESSYVECDNHLQLSTIFIGATAAYSAASLAEWKYYLGYLGERSFATKMAISLGSYSYTHIALLLRPVLVRNVIGTRLPKFRGMRLRGSHRLAPARASVGERGRNRRVRRRFKKPEYRLVPGMQNCNSFRFPSPHATAALQAELD
jgi:hypothetical protein